MENEYHIAMSKMTDEQLKDVLTVERNEYKSEAIEAAIKEAETRNLNITIENIHETEKTYTDNELLIMLTKLTEEQKHLSEKILWACNFFVSLTIISIIVMIAISLYNFT